ncbi:c-type cytochrome [Dokdonella sp.]|mgnify:CR=1 FL=1|uniref:c-type cytochrome n=1 Tax=Dokdonella sp. TaxID=2291710 RepID=UPI0031BFD9F3|nr:cytochrome c [Dokdonella sp.]
MKIGRGVIILAALVLPLLLLLAVVGGTLFARQGGFTPYRVPSGSTGPRPGAEPALLARGEYVARIGNCAGCHTRRGGEPFAGGRPFAGRWGTLYSSNLTPDAQAGIGSWSLAEFKHAMREGVSRDGVLYPAFPYAHFALLDDADLEALYAWLGTLPASASTPPANRLAFPAGWRPFQVLWRMLYYRPPNPRFGADMPAEWRRGRYLVDGLGHCGMCHSRRGPMQSLPDWGYLAGGRIPDSGWYAPPLDGSRLARYSAAQLADYLRSGTSAHGQAFGPMADVIYTSLRHLTRSDALAMAAFLQSVPPRAPMPAPPGEAAQAYVAPTRELYEQHCADCHGRDGRGKDGKYPPLVDAVSVSAPDPVDAVRLVLYGGAAPTTPGNPRPYSMPPFVQALDSADIAAIVNYIRVRFGQRPPTLTATDIDALHGIALD